MLDPFLRAFNVGPFHFDIGGSISPISIKDQMVRGRMIVDRAIEAGLIDTDQYHLLVIGAGAGGASAAIRAAQRDVKTTLIDIAPGPFLRQGGCASRWVDPTQYDWPVSHWMERRYPWKPPGMPLPWVPDFANTLAAVWTQTLKQAVRSYPRLLKERYNTTVSWHSVTPDNRKVQVQLTGDPQPRIYGMIVSCVGFGSEKCSINQYSGFKFWDSDDFEKPNLGLPSEKSARVLISGGGDGALQDFLRIITKEPTPPAYEKSPRQIYESLKQSIQGDKLLKWTEIENRLQSAEDQSQRAFIWGHSKEHDHDVHLALHKEYENAINDLFDPWRDNALQEIVEGRLEMWIRDPLPEIVDFVYPCSHFSKCYGLNRMLALLFAKYLSEHPRHSGKVNLYPKTSVFNVTGANHLRHTCAHLPPLCHGQDHEVTVRHPAECVSQTGTLYYNTRNYNVVIIRHGTNPPAASSITFPRQIIPYHVPS